LGMGTGTGDNVECRADCAPIFNLTGEWAWGKWE